MIEHYLHAQKKSEMGISQMLSHNTNFMATKYSCCVWVRQCIKKFSGTSKSRVVRKSKCYSKIRAMLNFSGRT